MTFADAWNATEAERAELATDVPCDRLVPGGRRLVRAVDVDAPAPLVFRWLCQLRVAPYSYDTLDNLKKGGRIGNAKALLATALSIKPIIDVTGGVVEQAGKQRTRSKALAHLVDKVRSHHGNIENLAVLHADCSDVDLFVEMLGYDADDIVIGEIGPVIGTHGGRGTIGVAFQVTDV